MKVLVTIFEELVPLSGGGTPRISNVIKALIRKGHQVYVASSIGVKKQEAIDRMGCVDLVPLWKVSRLSTNKMIKYLYAHPLNIWRVVRYARKIKPDLIISHNSIAGFAALWARRSHKECLTILDLTDLLFEYLQDYRSGRWMRLFGSSPTLTCVPRARRKYRLRNSELASMATMLTYPKEPVSS